LRGLRPALVAGLQAPQQVRGGNPAKKPSVFTGLPRASRSFIPALRRDNKLVLPFYKLNKFFRRGCPCQFLANRVLSFMARRLK
jgi:hypothetical protein